MDMSSVISLVSHVHTRDSKGVYQSTETLRQVYAEVESVTQQEFFEAGRNGLNPEYRFIIFAPDYNGEAEVEYSGSRYGIYRTYKTKTDRMELYVQRKGGLNKAVTS